MVRAMVVALLCAVAAAGADAPRSAEELRQRLHAAIVAKDRAAFLALIHLDDVSPTTRRLIQATNPGAFAFAQPTVDLGQLDAKEGAAIVMGDDTFVWNVTAMGVLKVADGADAAAKGMSMVYGERAGGWWIATRIRQRPP